jgi:hypothetical protein
MRRRLPATVGVIAEIVPTASMRPVNIALNERIAAYWMNGAVVQCRRSPDRQHVPAHALGSGVVRSHEKLNAIDETSAPESLVQQRTALDHHRAALERGKPAQRTGKKRRRQLVSYAKRLDLRPPSSQRSHSLRTRSYGPGRTEDYDGTSGNRREHPGLGWCPQPAIEYHAKKRPESIGAARREQRIVSEHRPRSNRDGVDFGSFAMNETVCCPTRQPRPLAGGEGDAAVERQRDLHSHHRPGLADAGEEGGVERFCFTLEHPRYDLEAMISKQREAPARHQRIRVFAGNHRATDTCLDDAGRAWAGPSGVATGFERAVQGRSARPSAGIVQRVNLGVRRARRFVETATDDNTLGVYDHGADHGIRRRATTSPLRQRQRARHECVVYHFSWNNASTYSSAENGIRSSMPSPTPT